MISAVGKIFLIFLALLPIWYLTYQWLIPSGNTTEEIRTWTCMRCRHELPYTGGPTDEKLCPRCVQQGKNDPTMRVLGTPSERITISDVVARFFVSLVALLAVAVFLVSRRVAKQEPEKAPAATGFIACPGCGHRMRRPAQNLRKLITCPACGDLFECAPTRAMATAPKTDDDIRKWAEQVARSRKRRH